MGSPSVLSGTASLSMDMDSTSVQDGPASDSGSYSGKPRLQLPASCEPPQANSPRKPLVWIVSLPGSRLRASGADGGVN